LAAATIEKATFTTRQEGTPSAYYTLNPATGAIDRWHPTRPLPEPRCGATAVVSNGYLYVAGGAKGLWQTYSDKVFVGKIGGDGLIEAWTETSTFAGARSSHAAAVYADRLYLAGGCRGDAAYCVAGFDDVQSAAIEDGRLGAWRTESSLSQGRGELGAAIHDGALYVIGGYDGNALTRVEYARIHAPARLGPWTEATALSGPRQAFAAVERDRRVVVIGGAEPTVLISEVGLDGTLAPWRSAPSLPQQRSELAAVWLKDRVCAAGGRDSVGAASPEVWCAPADASGLGPWENEAPLPAPLAAHAAAEWADRMYVVGGVGSSAVFMAPREPSGKLGPWESLTVLPSNRASHQLLAYGGRLYVLGGDAGGTTAEVLSASIREDGTLSAWTRAGTLPSRRRDFAAVARDGQLYVLGGRSNGSELLGDAWVASFRSDGTLGSFTPAAPLPEVRARAAAVLSGGQLFVLGGGSSEAQSSVYAARVVSPEASGSATINFDFGREMALVDSLTLSLDQPPPGKLGIEYRVAPESGVFSEVMPLGSFTRPSGIPLDQSGARYLWVRFTFDDSRAANGSGLDGGVTSLQGLRIDLRP
jgi:hypothetical protein